MFRLLLAFLLGAAAMAGAVVVAAELSRQAQAERARSTPPEPDYDLGGVTPIRARA